MTGAVGGRQIALGWITKIIVLGGGAVNGKIDRNLRLWYFIAKE
jgi:hypothetical protein